MKSLLLHIGSGKTGTSSIQRTLARAEREGRFPTVTYPVFGRPDHAMLAAVYKGPERLPRMLMARRRPDPVSFDAGTEKFRRGLFESIARHDNAIVSSEYLEDFPPEDARAFRDDLERAGVTRVRVLAYIRDPASYYLSFVQQRLRASHRFDPPTSFRYEFLRALTMWRSLFPDVVVRPYARDRLLDGDVVRDFLAQAEDFFGVALPADGLLAAEANRSLSAEGMIALQQYRLLHHPDAANLATDDTMKLIQQLEASHRELPQTSPTLRPDVENLVLHSHFDDLVELRDRFGLDLLPVAPSDSRVTVDAMSGIERVEDLLVEYDEVIVRHLLLHVLGNLLGVAQPES